MMASGGKTRTGAGDASRCGNSFEWDRSYADAVRPYGKSAFDDREHLQRYLTATEAPEAWQNWCLERFLWT
jgi:hypothetical protein